MERKIVSLAPGRTCLFGDHQDYLGLPVIACAIDRFVRLEAVENDQQAFVINMTDLGELRRIEMDVRFSRREIENDFLASVFRVLRRYGCVPDRGYDVTISADLPINAGLSSSSAFIVAWVRFMLRAFGAREPITPELIAQLAYAAEVLEYAAPGGKMDQYSIGLGEVLFIETGNAFAYERLTASISGLIIGESGIPKQTVGLLGSLKGKAIAAIRQLEAGVANFRMEDAREADLSGYLEIVDAELRPYLQAAVGNHTVTQRAYLELRKPKPDLARLGNLMNAHHALLRDQLKITVPKIDKMIEAALAAGAWGAKIVGSGGGGSIVALSAPGRESAIVEAILAAGGKAAYGVNVDPGARIIDED